MIPYIVGYKENGIYSYYRFLADDAEHALEQFRDAEHSDDIRVMFIVKE